MPTYECCPPCSHGEHELCYSNVQGYKCYCRLCTGNPISDDKIYDDD